MGNCMDIGPRCVPSFEKGSPADCGCIKVLHSSDGRISEFYEQSLKAAELMLEFPNQFLVELEKGNHRPSPLSADTDLKPCHAYLLLPMHRMSSTRISQEEMTCYISALCSHRTTTDESASPAPRSAKKKSSSKGRKPSLYGRSRVTPLVEDDDIRRDPGSESSETSYVSNQKSSYSFSCPVIPQELLDAVLSSAAPASSSSMRRSRSWMPKLETITAAAESLIREQRIREIQDDLQQTVKKNPHDATCPISEENPARLPMAAYEAAATAAQPA